MADLTVILVNYRRYKNMKKIIDNLVDQRPKVDIFVWNNGETLFFDNRVDWIINSTKNVHTHMSPYLCMQARTEFVCRMDDDLLPLDRRVMADAVDRLRSEDDRERMLCTHGVVVGDDGYYKGDPKLGGRHVSNPDIDIEVDLCKGRMLFFRPETLRGFNPDRDNAHMDLQMSMYAAGARRRFHRTVGCLYKRDEDLPTEYDDGNSGGYDTRPDHWRVRNQMTRDWIQTCEHVHESV